MYACTRMHTSSIHVLRVRNIIIMMTINAGLSCTCTYVCNLEIELISL